MNRDLRFEELEEYANEFDCIKESWTWITQREMRKSTN